MSLSGSFEAGAPAVDQPPIVHVDRRSFRLRGTPLRVLSVAVVLVLWEIVTRLQLVPPLFLPSPQEVFVVGLRMWGSGDLQKHIAASLLRVIQGFAIGSLGGIVLGIVMGQNRTVGLLVRPILEMLRPIPGLAWVPLVLVWFGIGETGKIALIAWGTFYPVLTSSFDGVQSVNPQLLRASRSLGAGPRQVFLHVLLPATLPYIFTGLSIAMGMSFSILVAAELVAATTGMGWMITDGRRFFRTDVVILGMVLIGIFGFVFIQAILQVRKRLLYWHLGEMRR